MYKKNPNKQQRANHNTSSNKEENAVAYAVLHGIPHNPLECSVEAEGEKVLINAV